MNRVVLILDDKLEKVGLKAVTAELNEQGLLKQTVPQTREEISPC